MSSFTEPFDVIIHNVELDDKPFEINRKFKFYSNKIDGLVINIPHGYRTNFASVPRIFWSIIPPVGRYSKATVIHDWLIDNIDGTNLNIHQVNMVFKEAMDVLGVKPITSNIMYISVELYWTFGRPIQKLFGKYRKD